VGEEEGGRRRRIYLLSIYLLSIIYIYLYLSLSSLSIYLSLSLSLYVLISHYEVVEAAEAVETHKHTQRGETGQSIRLTSI